MAETKGSEENKTDTTQPDTVNSKPAAKTASSPRKTGRAAGAAKKTPDSTAKKTADKAKPAPKKNSPTSKKDDAKAAAAVSVSKSKATAPAKNRSAAAASADVKAPSATGKAIADSASSGATAESPATDKAKSTPKKNAPKAKTPPTEKTASASAGAESKAAPAKKTAGQSAAANKTASEKTAANKTASKKSLSTRSKTAVSAAVAEKDDASSKAAETGLAEKATIEAARKEEGQAVPKSMNMLKGSDAIPLKGSEAKELPSSKQHALGNNEAKALEANGNLALSSSEAKALPRNDEKELQDMSAVAPARETEEKPVQGRKKTARQTRKSQHSKTGSGKDAVQKQAEPDSSRLAPAKEANLQEPAGETASAPVAGDVIAESKSSAETATGRHTSRKAQTRGSQQKKGGSGLQKKSEAAGVTTSDKTDVSPEKNEADTKVTTNGDAQKKKGQPAQRTPRRKMFVSVQPEEQIEVVITEEGQVQEYYVEMLQQQKTKGNIYKATIHNVDANLQAAFVNYGANKNGFLQIDEVHPEYYNVPHDENSGRRYPPIQKVLKAGQELLVQVVKEPNASKGAFLTTYLSLAGRFLVLTPGREQIGVSRKVDNDEERGRLREMLEDFKPGAGLGVIVRTVSAGINKATLKKDLQSLKNTWKDVRKLGTEEVAPKLIYQEIGLATRSIRDYLTDQIVEVWIDDTETAQDVEKLVSNLFPKKSKLVHVHTDFSLSLFERFNLQRQLDQIQSREVALPSGGRLVIDTTEALTAIDINSGRSGGKTNFEDMAFRTNVEAAKMIPLQLRLRDIGGQVVCDFIEMRDKGHWREVEKTIRGAMKIDRARHDIGRISSFGLLELVRQRLGSSAISANMEVCPHCKGSGVRRNMEWQSQQALKDITRKMRAAKEQKLTEIVYAAELPLAMQLLNGKRQRLSELEEQLGVKVEITLLQNS